MPKNESLRLADLRRYAILDTPPEPDFDHIARLAADLFDVPTALISFVDKDTQFFKARVGFEACETSREVSFCAHALCSDAVLVIPDALQDARFKDNPLVTSAPFIRFYAGAPLCSRAGHNIGSVCIIDVKPRAPLTKHQQSLLQSIAAITMDHLERRRLSILMRASLRMAATTPDAIVCSGEDGSITFWNAAAETMFGYSRDEIIGRSLDLIIPTESYADHNAGTGMRHPHGKSIEVLASRKDRTRVPVEVSIAVWQDGKSKHIGATMRNISERHQAQERLRHSTHFDSLTGLPNRVRFLEAIEEALTDRGMFTVFKIGLDRFKDINTSMGMEAGDTVLKTTGQRVVSTVGAKALVARLGADEFGVLLHGAADPVDAGSLGDRIRATLSEPFKVHGATCRLNASIGIVLCSGLSVFEGANAVLRSGLLALQHAKKEGGRRHEIFQPRLGQVADERARLNEELREAFVRGEFELWYQPQVRLFDHRIVGAEALLRWRHPQHGLLSPADFLPVLETSEIAVDVGRWILSTACDLAAKLLSRGTPLRMGVNLFAVQLRDELLLRTVSEILTSAGLSPELLELEITENTILRLDGEDISPLRSLRDLGVGIAFDDYGTGFASLSLLKQYPVTRLKIDREFVRDLQTDPDDVAIVKSVLALGSSLGLQIIAEGIENTEQASILATLGCEEAQGYLFGKPMPAQDFLQHVAGHSRRAA